MLYNNFIICMMSCAMLALINIIDNQDWQYIILPIGIILWGFFKFFDEDDREYLKGLGIDPDKYNAIFPSLSDDYQIHKQTYSSTPKREGNTITWDGSHTFDSNLYGKSNRGWDNPLYKGMAKKCKRNFKITVNEKKENVKRKRESIFHGSNNFGW